MCLQGGIHPSFTGDTYLNIVRAVKDAVPQMHVHAFSPLEVTHGARTLGLPVRGLSGATARCGALDTCPARPRKFWMMRSATSSAPDKLTHRRMARRDRRRARGRPAHDRDDHVRARRDSPFIGRDTCSACAHCRPRTGGITEFVPLGYVHMEAPLWRKGRTRSGPTFREAVLMHAVPRLVLHPLIPNIQVSWVKMGADGCSAVPAKRAPTISAARS